MYVRRSAGRVIVGRLVFESYATHIDRDHIIQAIEALGEYETDGYRHPPPRRFNDVVGYASVPAVDNRPRFWRPVGKPWAQAGRGEYRRLTPQEYEALTQGTFPDEGDPGGLVVSSESTPLSDEDKDGLAMGARASVP